MNVDINRVIVALATLVLLFACTHEDRPEGSAPAPSVTIGYDHVSAVSAVLSGKANLEHSVPPDLKIGFQFSKLAGLNSTTVEAVDADADYNYTMAITGLEPDTKYCFRSFIHQDGQDAYGETKEFTTKSLSSLLETKEATGIEASRATLNALLDLTDVPYESLSCGFFCGDSEEDIALNNHSFSCTNKIKDNAISVDWTDLSHKTQYWYKAYVHLDSRTYYGGVKSFTTGWIPVEEVSLDKTDYSFYTIGNSLHLKATVLPLKASDNSLEWSSDNEKVAKVDQNGNVMAIDNGWATIIVTSKDQRKTATCIITVAQRVTNITLSKKRVLLVAGDEETISVTSILPDNAKDKSYSWSSADNSIASVDQNGTITAISKGETGIEVRANDGSNVYDYCVVFVRDPYTATAGEAVDLGLSVKWSSTNLGATLQTDYGDYFAWGETGPKPFYMWENYELCNGSESTLTRYNFDSSYGTVDHIVYFGGYNYEDDAARQTLGGKWRMPTQPEWWELMSCCSSTWVEDYNGSGINGWQITATNGNSIFLPAAGWYRIDNHINAGSGGYYWSSQLYNAYDPFLAEIVFFNSGFSGYDSFGRSSGLSVRPVTE